VKTMLVALLIALGFVPASNAFAQTGNCAVVYAAVTRSGNYGTIETYGAAWGRASIAEAQTAARADLMRSLNGAQMDNTIVGAAQDGTILLASGCGHAHGAVVGELKTTGSNDGQWHTFGNTIFSDTYAVLADSSEAAGSQARSNCIQGNQSHVYDQFCRVVASW